MDILAFSKVLLKTLHWTKKARERVVELINNRNYFGVEEYLDSIMVKRSSKEAFAALGNLVGGVEVLAKAKNIAPNSSGIMAVKRLEKIYDILALYGVDEVCDF